MGEKLFETDVIVVNSTFAQNKRPAFYDDTLLVYWVDMIIFLDFKETYTIFQFYLKEKIVHGKVEHMQIALYFLNPFKWNYFYGT